MNDDLFWTADDGAPARLRAQVEEVVTALERATGSRARTDLSPAQLDAVAADLVRVAPEPLPVDVLYERAVAHAVQAAHPATAAHLHPPALLPAVAAEVAVAATNQSLDSHDQAPLATAVELRLVAWLAERLGLPDGATGVMTAGGTASNLLGLTLARDAAARRIGVDVAAAGLPPDAARWRILTSAASHFSVAQAAAVLGLGHRAVVPVATDDVGRIDLGALDAALARLAAADEVPIAVVGTAGTTDLGAVDPLAALADRARSAGTWFHVDAAVGSALALSDRHRGLLAGIEHADSVTADLHKLWWQPFSASALLVRDPAAFAAVRAESAYLDRDEDVADGVTNLVGRSLDTSRRFDALKVVASLRAVGLARMERMVDHLLDLAAEAGDAVAACPGLALVAPPQTVTCVFRWIGDTDDGDAADAGDPAVAEELDAVMTAAARALFASGRAVVGRTRIDGQVALKLTFVNPVATADDARRLVLLVADECRAVVATGQTGT